MEWPDNIPSPFRFNTLKHHAGSIREFICLFSEKPDSSFKQRELIERLNRAGSSVSDLYVGDLTVGEILESVRGRLTKYNALSPGGFAKWVNASGTDERYIEQDDGSIWILKQLKGKAFIHLFPSRGSNHTIRIKGNSLKTAVYLIIKGFQSFPETGQLNRLRSEINLSPVGPETDLKAIRSLMRLLTTPGLKTSEDKNT